jgi:putative membrane protein
MWKVLASVAIGVVAALHIAFFVLESFLWTTPTGRRIFGMTSQLAESTKVLAANQGLYNAFLAAGLIWGVMRPNAFSVRLFFLACVIVAGIAGGLTAKRSILLVQALPGVIALLLVLLART